MISSRSMRFTPARRRRGWTMLIVVVVAIVAVTAVAALAYYVSQRTAGEDNSQLTAVIGRSDFFHDVVESGEVESSDNVEVQCEVKSRNGAGTTILEVHVEEGKTVPQGKLLVTLDSSALDVERQQERIILNNKEAMRDQAFNLLITAISSLIEYVGQEEFVERHREKIEEDIVRKAADAAINAAIKHVGQKEFIEERRKQIEDEIINRGAQSAVAVLLEHIGQEDLQYLLRRHREKIEKTVSDKGAQEVLPEIQSLLAGEATQGSYHVEQQGYQAELFLAEENFRKAEQYFRYSESLAAQGYVTELQLKSDQFAVEKAHKDRDAAQTKLDVLRIHTKKKTEKTLMGDIYNALAVYLAEKDSANIQSNRVKEIEAQVGKCFIHAPAAGRVVFANDRDRRGDSDFVVEAGATVREGRVIIRLPSSTKMQVEAKINESKIALVEPGRKATITIDAFKDITREGVVTHVSQYPEASHWFSSSVKQYETKIQILNPPPELKSGLTAKVRIHAQHIPNALQAPIQSVHRHHGLFYCFVKDGRQWRAAPVTLGASNEKHVVIEDGLNEGDVVAMDPASLLEDVDLPGAPQKSDEQLAGDADALSSKYVGQEIENDEKQSADGDGPSPSDAAVNSPGGQPSVGAIVSAIFTNSDANKDGKLAKDELPERFQANFSTTDSNGDGGIDRAEMTAAMAKRMRERQSAGGQGE